MSLSSVCDDFCRRDHHHQPPVDISPSTLRWASFLLFNLFAFFFPLFISYCFCCWRSSGRCSCQADTAKYTSPRIYIYIYIYIFDIREAADPSSTYVEYETRQPGLLGIFKRSNLSPAPPLLVRTHIQAVTGQALSHRDLRSFFCLIIRSWSLGLTSGNWTAAIDGTHCGKNGGKYWSHKGAS